MNPALLAIFTQTDAIAVGVGAVLLLGLYLAFRVAKFILHKLIVLAVLLALGLAAWWFYTAHHGQ